MIVEIEVTRADVEKANKAAVKGRMIAKRCPIAQALTRHGWEEVTVGESEVIAYKDGAFHEAYLEGQAHAIRSFFDHGTLATLYRNLGTVSFDFHRV